MNIKIQAEGFDSVKPYEAVHVTDHVGKTMLVAEDFYVSVNDKGSYVKIPAAQVTKVKQTPEEIIHEMRSAVLIAEGDI
jgi:hypothetical protein